MRLGVRNRGPIVGRSVGSMGQYARLAGEGARAPHV